MSVIFALFMFASTPSGVASSGPLIYFHSARDCHAYIAERLSHAIGHNTYKCLRRPAAVWSD